MINLSKINLRDYFKNNKTQGAIFIALVSALVLVFYLNLFLFPQIGRVTDVLSKTGRMNADLNSAESDIAKIDKFKSNIESYKEKVDRYEKMLPAEQEIPSLLENLSGMAQNSNIKIIGITPITTGTAPKNDKDRGRNQIYQEIPILISARSGYHELGAFLSNLENSDRFMKVVDIEMRSNKAAPKKHDVELIVCTYILLKER